MHRRTFVVHMDSITAGTGAGAKGSYSPPFWFCPCTACGDRIGLTAAYWLRRSRTGRPCAVEWRRSWNAGASLRLTISTAPAASLASGKHVPGLSCEGRERIRPLQLMVLCQVKEAALGQSGLCCVVAQQRKVVDAKEFWHNGKNVDMPVRRMIFVNGCHPEKRRIEPFFKCLHCLIRDVTHVEITTGIFKRRVRAQHKSVKEHTLVCLINDPVGFFPGHRAITAKEGTGHAFPRSAASVLDVANAGLGSPLLPAPPFDIVRFENCHLGYLTLPSFAHVVCKRGFPFLVE